MSETVTNYLGRCPAKDCDYAFFATAEDVRTADDWSGVRVHVAARVDGGPRVWTRCPAHRNFPLERVRGTFSEVHNCDSRCLNAKGTSCTCSCGGANHGRGHAATHTAVADPVQEATDAYLAPGSDMTGEEYVAAANAPATPLPAIGTTIRSNVAVSAKRTDVGQYNACLYTFKTDKGGVVKWFAPSYCENFAEVGDTLTIRAEVKGHDEWRGEHQVIVKNVKKVED
jgi:hypothetical protein